MPHDFIGLPGLRDILGIGVDIILFNCGWCTVFVKDDSSHVAGWIFIHKILEKPNRSIPMFLIVNTVRCESWKKIALYIGLFRNINFVKMISYFWILFYKNMSFLKDILMEFEFLSDKINQSKQKFLAFKCLYRLRPFVYETIFYSNIFLVFLIFFLFKYRDTAWQAFKSFDTKIVLKRLNFFYFSIATREYVQIF